ncbi:hypothetical protein ACJX0J_037408, partial [Zea mays]
MPGIFTTRIGSRMLGQGAVRGDGALRQGEDLGGENALLYSFGVQIIISGRISFLMLVLLKNNDNLASNEYQEDNNHFLTKDLELKTREWSSTKQVIFYEIFSILFQVLFFKIVYLPKL